MSRRVLLGLAVALAFPTPASAHGSVGFVDEAIQIGVLILIAARGHRPSHAPI